MVGVVWVVVVDEEDVVDGDADAVDGDELDEDEDEDEDELVAAVEGGAHDSVSDLTEFAGTDGGRLMLESGVPGATSTWNV